MRSTIPPSLEEMRTAWTELGEWANLIVSARGHVKVPFYRKPSLMEYNASADVCDVNHIDFRVQRTRLLDHGEKFLDIQIIGNGQVVFHYRVRGWR